MFTRLRRLKVLSVCLAVSLAGLPVTPAFADPNHSNNIEEGGAGGEALDFDSNEKILLAQNTGSDFEKSSQGSGGGGQGPQGANPLSYTNVQPPASPKFPDPQVDLSTGALVYRYPIQLPAGMGDMAPALELVYNSQDKKEGSLIGHGWSLSIPNIVREHRFGIDESFKDTKENFISSFSGILIPIDSAKTKFAPKNEDGSFLIYETQRNSKNRIEAAWRTETKDGKVYTFGSVSNSKYYSVPYEASYAWFLDKIEDKMGRRINYSYKRPNTDDPIYPDSIGYTNTATSSGAVVVQFGYEPRPDVYTSYAHGTVDFPIITRSRIKDIIITISGRLRRKYSLSYTQNSITKRSLLSSITETGYDDAGGVPTSRTVNFTYMVQDFTSHEVQEIPRSSSNPLNFTFRDEGIVAADVNGDGYSDLLLSTGLTGSPAKKKIFQNKTTLRKEDFFAQRDAAEIPHTICTRTAPLICQPDGLVVFDVNADFFSDLIYSETTVRAVYLYNPGESKWSHSPSWSRGMPNLIPAPDRRPGIADIVGQGRNGFYVVYKTPTEGRTEAYKAAVDVDGVVWAGIGIRQPNLIPDHYGVTAVDVNRDGLADLVRAYKNSSGSLDQRVLINTGFEFKVDTGWQFSPSIILEDQNGPTGGFFADVNGDDFPEYISGSGVVHLFTSKGWDLSPRQSFGSHPSDELRFGDFNADGILDGIRNCCSHYPQNSLYINELHLSKGKIPDVLEKVTLPEGATHSFSYKFASQYKAADGTLLNPKLALAVQTVERVTTTEPVLQKTSTRSYVYSGGHYYLKDGLNRQFAGFEQVTEIRPDNSKKINYFHQGNESKGNLYEYDDHQSKIGRNFRTDIQDSAGNLMTRTTTKFEKTELIPLGQGRYFVYPVQTITEDYDGNATHRDKAFNLTFDTQTGDLKEETNFGEVNASTPLNFADVGDDKIITKYSYAVNGSLRLLAGQEVFDQQNAKVGETKTYFDGLSTWQQVLKGLPTKEERLISNGGSPVYAVIERKYNALGLVTEEKDPNGNPTTYQYDLLNLYPEIVTNALGHITKYFYDYATGKVKETIDPNGSRFVTKYDGLGRVVEERVPDPLNGNLVLKTSIQYTDTPLQYKILKTDYLNAALAVDTHTYLDGLGREIQVRKRAEDQAGTPTYSVIDIQYDTKGRIKQRSLFYFNANAGRTPPTNNPIYVTFEYDALDRVTKEETPLGATYSFYEDWWKAVADPLGHLKIFGRDAHNRLSWVSEYINTTALNTYYGYDANGNLTAIYDAAGNNRFFGYDFLGRRLWATDLFAPTDPTYGFSLYQYDKVGNLTQKVTPVSSQEWDVIDYQYDALNRLTSEDWQGEAGIEVTYRYDTCLRGLSRICEAENSAAKTTVEYNFAGGVSKETSHMFGYPFDMKFSYDLAGNVTETIDPDGSTTTFAFNKAGLEESVAWKEYDGAPPRTIVSNFDYSQSGELTAAHYGNGTRLENTYYDASQLYRLQKKTLLANNSPFKTFEYEYDAVGNVTKITEGDGTQVTRTSDFAYDDLDRLLSSTVTLPGKPPAVQTFKYDAIGNITFQTGYGDYKYEGSTIPDSYANPHAVTTTGPYKSTYDWKGNLITDSSGSSSVYNFKNQLSQVNLTQFPSTYFSYDALGRRVMKIYDQTATIYPSRFWNYNGTMTTKHIFARGEPIATIETDYTVTKLFFNHMDHLNSTSLVTDEAATKAEEIVYKPFGEILSDTSPVNHDEQRKFTGHEFDGTTGLIYAEARYLNGFTGRFVSQDPVFLAVGDPSLASSISRSAFLFDYAENLAGGLSKERAALEALLSHPQALNSYSYVVNNPLKYVDKEGEIAFLAGVVVLLKVVGVGAAVGIGSQYVEDVASDIVAGKSFSEVVTPHSSLTEYGISALSGVATMGHPFATNVVRKIGVGFVIGSTESLAQDFAEGRPLDVGHALVEGVTESLSPVTRLAPGSSGVVRVASETVVDLTLKYLSELLFSLQRLLNQLEAQINSLNRK